MRQILFFFMILFSSIAFAETYSTWDTLELDTCASAWLIKRFIDEDAVFKFFPKGEFISEGIPFDTPDAELRRKHGISTYESILKKYNVKDNTALKIGKIIHELEVNYWESDKSENARFINDGIQKIIYSDNSPEDIFNAAFDFIDNLDIK